MPWRETGTGDRQRGLPDVINASGGILGKRLRPVFIDGGADPRLIAAAYFRALATESALDLTDAYARKHGPEAPALNNMAESCFEGLMALAGLMSRAQAAAPQQLAAVGDQVGYDGPRGAMQIRNGNVRQHVYRAKANGFSFDILQRL